MSGGEHEIARERGAGAEIAARADEHDDVAAGTGAAHNRSAADQSGGGRAERSETASARAGRRIDRADQPAGARFVNHGEARAVRQGDRQERCVCARRMSGFRADLLHALWIDHEAGITGSSDLSALLMAYFGAGFGVLGVYVSAERKREKQAGATGEPPPSGIGEISKAVVKRK